jgi:DNA-binding MarR family transcriptional regulator
MTKQFSLEDDCFAIRQAARFASQIYDRHLAQVGLTTTQFSMLRRLKAASRLTMMALAEAMVMDRTSVVRAIRPLQRDGLLTTGTGAAGRGLTLVLTEHGNVMLESAWHHWRAAQEEFEQRFGAERSASLRRELFDMTRD